MNPSLSPHTPRRFQDLPVQIQQMFDQIKKYFWLEDTVYFYEMACFHGWAIHQDIPPLSPAFSPARFNPYGPIVNLVIGDFWAFEYNGNTWYQVTPKMKQL